MQWLRPAGGPQQHFRVHGRGGCRGSSLWGHGNPAVHPSFFRDCVTFLEDGYFDLEGLESECGSSRWEPMLPPHAPGAHPAHSDPDGHVGGPSTQYGGATAAASSAAHTPGMMAPGPPYHRMQYLKIDLLSPRFRG